MSENQKIRQDLLEVAHDINNYVDSLEIQEAINNLATTFTKNNVIAVIQRCESYIGSHKSQIRYMKSRAIELKPILIKYNICQ
jgi:hypothetical protein